MAKRKMVKINLTVKGMHCNSCKMLVTDALQELGASNISVDMDEKKQVGKVAFEFAGNKQDAINVIEAEGYKAV